jgi:integrase
MARRGHGEGSIYQRKDGRWVASITLEHRKRKYFYGETRKEVQEKLKTVLHEQQQGMLAAGPQQLLKAYLERWLEQVCKLTMRPNTYKEYRSIVYRHLIPSLGYIKLQKLTAEKVQEFCAQKQNEGLSSGTVATIHSVLNTALENAVRWGLIARNVAKLVTLPHRERYEAQTLTMEQALKLIALAQGSRIEALLLVALTTGMRRGELLALRWDDIDFERGMLHVRRTMSHIPGMGYKEGEPKTKAGRRTIVLSSVTIEALKEHCVAQDQVRITAGEKWQERGIVFCNIYGGFFNPVKVLALFQRLLRDAGLPKMRFHDLRHSAATILLEARVHLKMVQERLGHSSIATTADIYSHISPEMQQETVDKIDDLFRRS